MRYAVIEPILVSNQIEFIMDEYLFWFFIFHAVGIAAAGNIINDYFDVMIDKINKPESVIIGNQISRKNAMLLHQFITGIALLPGLWIAFNSQSVTIAFIMIVIPGLLWFYSSVYKRQLLIGNIIIAFLTAMVPLLLILIVNRFLIQHYGSTVVELGVTKVLFIVIAIYAGFAFITNLMREIVKDIEDEEGDRELECNTLPIAIGIPFTKIIISTLASLTMVGVYYIYHSQLKQIESSLLFQYLLWLILVPLLIMIILVVLAKNKTDFHRISTLLKYIMASGIVFSLAYYLTLARELEIPFFGLIIK